MTHPTIVKLLQQETDEVNRRTEHLCARVRAILPTADKAEVDRLDGLLSVSHNQVEIMRRLHDKYKA